MPVTDPGNPQEHGLHTVSDVMTHTVVAVGRDASFKEIVQMMEQWKVSALPVLEGEGRVIGIVSEADLLPKEEFRDSIPRGSSSAGGWRTWPSRCADRGGADDRARHLRARRRSPPPGRPHHGRTARQAPARHRCPGAAARCDQPQRSAQGLPALRRRHRRRGTPRGDRPVFPGQHVGVTVEDGVVELSGRVRDSTFVPVAAGCAVPSRASSTSPGNRTSAPTAAFPRPARRDRDALSRRVPRSRAGPSLLDRLRRVATRPWRIMEVCGGQTHTLVRQASTNCCPPASA